MTLSLLWLFPFLILLFVLIHFKWLKWINIPNNEGHLGTYFFDISHHQQVSSCLCVRMGVIWRSVEGKEGHIFEI